MRLGTISRKFAGQAIKPLQRARRSCQWVMLGTAALALPDLLLRLYVNATISPVDTRILCAGKLAGTGRMINWQHVPHDNVSDQWMGRVAGYLCQPFPRGFQRGDFSEIQVRYPLGELMDKLDASGGLRLVNVHHYIVDASLRGFLLLPTLAMAIIFPKVFNFPKRVGIAVSALFLAGVSMQTLEVALRGYVTDYIYIRNLMPPNLADIYGLAGLTILLPGMLLGMGRALFSSK